MATVKETCDENKEERSESPTPSCQSLKSDSSMIQPIKFDDLSLHCDEREERSESPTPSCQSLKSDSSMIQPIKFDDLSLHCDESSMVQPIKFDDLSLHCDEREERCEPASSCQPLKSGSSMIQSVQSDENSTAWDDRAHLQDKANFTPKAQPLNTASESDVDTQSLKQKCQEHSRALEMLCNTDQTVICKECAVKEHRDHSIFYTVIPEVPETSSLLQNAMSNAKAGMLSVFKRHLCEEYPECFNISLDELNVPSVVDRMIKSFGGEVALRIVLDFFYLNQTLSKIQERMKDHLRRQCAYVTEGNAHPGAQSILTEIYTSLYITEDENEVNDEHEVRQIEYPFKRNGPGNTAVNLYHMFKPSTGQNRIIKTVLTKGIAGIGKTVSVQKLLLDWADGQAYQDMHFVLPLPLRDLNLVTQRISLVQLLHQYFPDLKELRDIEDDFVNVLYILDGLDECRLPLNFQRNARCNDITQQVSVDELLTNLIVGNLHPSAKIWITSRPAATRQIPPECIHLVTEIRGFNDAEKEEYFRKKFSNQAEAEEIISHIKSRRSLHIMCHIPVFCWISATVLAGKLHEGGKDKFPKTQTEMYTHFLLIQSMGNKKYHQETSEDSVCLSEKDRLIILKLGKLAFHQLEKGNLIFYANDLKECGIDISKTWEYSSLCTELFREEFGMYRKQVYSFVHLSIQEFMAAVYVLCCSNDGENVLSSHGSSRQEGKMKLADVLRCAVVKATNNKNGHFDLFLRFLLGLSLDSNQKLLQTLWTQRESSSPCIKETKKLIEETIKKEKSTERVINLFHCLNELNDNTLVDQIQSYLKGGTPLNRDLPLDQCSAFAFALLMSEVVLDVFDPRLYTKNEGGIERLLPVLQKSKRARLSQCIFQMESCETVATALQMKNSPVEDLDLSSNRLKDIGLRILSDGLLSPHCRLKKLSLRDCNLTDKCCIYLAKALTMLQLSDLDLRDNDIRDRGVMQLSDGLKDQQCQLQFLGLSGCQVTEAGCVSLAEALTSNPLYLRELDLSYNHPGDEGFWLLSKVLKNSKLEKLSLDHGGDSRVRPGLSKYATHLTLDPDSANRYLQLSEDNKKVQNVGREQPYQNHPQRFVHARQVVSRESLDGGRFYWEVKWSGAGANIGVTHRDVSGPWESVIGLNERSWCLQCNTEAYTFSHNNNSILLPCSSNSKRVGLFLDCPDGMLSFYSVSSGNRTLLHTFHAHFTEPLYPVFGLNTKDAAVNLCLPALGKD